MKTLLTLFVLLFSSSVFAEDISDFEIEGMSLGDSLLDYSSEKKILSNKVNQGYKNDKFSFFELRLNDSQIYEYIKFGIETKDKDYIIHQISGFIFYDNDIKSCYNQKDLIVKDLSLLLKNSEIFDEGIVKHEADPSGETTDNTVYFYYDSNDNIKVSCVDWSARLTKEKGWRDNLKVVIANSKIVDWFINEAY